MRNSYIALAAVATLAACASRPAPAPTPAVAPAPTDVGGVLQIPGVTDVRQDREAVEIHARVAEPVVRALLARDSSLSALEVSSAGLEEAFLALTQENGGNANR